MSKYLDRAKELRAITEIHYNCAQSVLIPFAADAGLTEELAYNLGSNFGSGMKFAGTCGAITGGLMVLGLFGVEDGRSIGEYYRHFKENHQGYLDCANLLRMNKEKGLPKKMHCDSMVYEAIEVVEGMLKERGIIAE